METMFQNRTTLILNTRVPEDEEKEDRSTLPRAVSLADIHVGSPDQLGGKAKSQKTSRLFPLHRNSRISRVGEKFSRILTSSLSNPVDTTASPMTTLKSSKATAPVSLMFKHSLSSKNKRKQSRVHRRTTDAGVTDGSLFEVLRETIHSEVATVISQNETRPCFLIELFYQLQPLNTDYLRQRALFALKDRVARHLSERDVTEDQPVPASPVLQASPTTELTSRETIFSTYASSMVRYAGRPLRGSGGDLLGDLSEIIFHELAFFHLMQDMNRSAVKQNVQCTNTITAPAVKWTCYTEPGIRVRQCVYFIYHHIAV
uniref:Pericentriolar material 1 protein C-terminal domain-containing protein n=1 Tax=Hucho hucho TaxID=62062 RepID=A0A4W5PG46_9TELE